jgi:uncharacterized protein YbjT (DUF2867 family)
MTTTRPGPILVAGATGQQGGAAMRHLLRGGWKVRALTRNPQGEAARRLAQQGAEVVRGDFDDATSLRQALEGAYGVFSVQNMLQVGTEREAQQGMALAEAAQAARVRHFVYSSVGGAERNTGIGHFESKWRIEQRIRELGLPATILRPVFFTDNLLATGPMGFIFWGAVAGALRGGRRLQVIAVDDIGAIAARVFAEPERFVGQALEIAGDEPTLEEMVAAFRRVKGRRPWFLPLPAGLLARMDADLGAMFRWFATEGYRADISAVRALHPELHGFETGLRMAGLVQEQRRA